MSHHPKKVLENYGIHSLNESLEVKKSTKGFDGAFRYRLLYSHHQQLGGKDNEVVILISPLLRGHPSNIASIDKVSSK